MIERRDAAADEDPVADGLAPEILKRRVAASRAMAHNLRAGALKVGRLVAVSTV